ncbi:hypothetical protein Bca4012_048708 [Brassica carinata]
MEPDQDYALLFDSKTYPASSEAKRDLTININKWTSTYLQQISMLRREHFQQRKKVVRGEIIDALQCNHIYHHRCIIDWIRMNLKCPTCRDTISLKTCFKLN